MQAPRLVATDVDGTLLDSADRVPPRAGAAISRLVTAGVPFVLVTGRPPRWIPPVVERLPVTRLAVCANGGLLYDALEDRVLWSRSFEAEALREIADRVAAALPDAGMAVERSDAGTPDGPTFLADPGYRHAWEGGDSHVVPRAELFTGPAVKLLVRSTGRDSASMAAVLTAALGDLVSVTFSHPGGLVEVSLPGVTKGSGLAAVAEELGVARSDVLAFGDMPNDLEMLRWAGHGVAMGNAHPELREVADEVTASNDADGLAQVLERWF